MNKIIFFDINGTIIKRDKRTDIPFQKALDLFLEIQDSMDGVDTSARSDKDVFMEVLEKYETRFTDERWNSFLKVYEFQLEKFKTTDVWRANVDAVDFIQRLSKSSINLSLISGELSIGAKYKLEKLGLWQYFPTGGFGEDHLTRFGIAEAALAKAKKHYKKDFDEIYVIGDTILDIKTAKHLGAKVISIATGSNTKEELAREKPHFLIDRFSELEGLF